MEYSSREGSPNEYSKFYYMIEAPYIALNASASRMACLFLTDEEMGRVIKKLVFEQEEMEGPPDIELTERERITFETLNVTATERRSKYQNQIKNLKHGGIEEHLKNDSSKRPKQKHRYNEYEEIIEKKNDMI